MAHAKYATNIDSDRKLASNTNEEGETNKQANARKAGEG